MEPCTLEYEVLRTKVLTIYDNVKNGHIIILENLRWAIWSDLKTKSIIKKTNKQTNKLKRQDLLSQNPGFELPTEFMKKGKMDIKARIRNY